MTLTNIIDLLKLEAMTGPCRCKHAAAIVHKSRVIMKVNDRYHAEVAVIKRWIL